MSRLNGIKQYGTAIYPVHAAATSGLLQRSEPIITPEQLVSRFLKGIPLTFPNGDKFTDADIKDRIYLATNESELLLGAQIFPEIFKEKLPFDYALYKSYINVTMTHRPVQSMEYIAIVSADGNNIFEIPPTWVETSNFSKGILNVIPLLAAYGINQVSGAVGNAGIAFLTVMDGLNWVPAYWEVGYVAGLSNTEGQVPTPVNELIGCVAAIAMLSEIGPNFIYTSQSQSQDGISQSSSSLGPRIYQLRIAELTEKRDELVRKLKSIFATRYYVGNF
jgi:hypothetical protein